MALLGLKLIAGLALAVLVALGIAIVRFMSRVPRPRLPNRPEQFRGYLTPPDLEGRFWTRPEAEKPGPAEHP